MPVITCLRDAQMYIQAAAMGQTLLDVPRSQSKHEYEHWLPLVEDNKRELSNIVNHHATSYGQIDAIRFLTVLLSCLAMEMADSLTNSCGGLQRV